jgi:hypothetical protein
LADVVDEVELHFVQREICEPASRIWT